MRLPILFTGIFATFAFAWFGQTLVPQSQLGNLQPQTDEDGGDIYPVNNSGIVKRGREVYISEGCYYCHTEQVRSADGGADIDRGWGARRTVARDYIYSTPVVLGQMRVGPDLTNIGNPDLPDIPSGEDNKKRWHDAAWHFAHLYDPAGSVEGSIMPTYRYLFQKQKIQGQRSADALNLQGDAAPDAGYEVVPAPDAKALVAYLLSLDSTHALKEVKQEAPAK
jgi:cytochrome c oxidase cbb3-type subunit II